MAPPQLFLSAVELEGWLQARHFPFCFIGGIAVQRWGEPRNTLDLDLTLVTGFGGEEPFIDALLCDFHGRIEDVRSFAIAHRVLLLSDRHGVDLDIALGAMPFEERSIERSSLFDLGETGTITTCSAEDLVVHKAFANRDRDWADVRTIITRQDEMLDWPLILEELKPLCDLKGAPDILDKLESLRRR